MQGRVCQPREFQSIRTICGTCQLYRMSFDSVDIHVRVQLFCHQLLIVLVGYDKSLFVRLVKQASAVANDEACSFR